MQNNDFEKQVHQKMGELKLLPSEAVWEQVERRLHRKEKRRSWIIWFPLLLSGLSLAGYFSLHTRQILPSNRIPLTVNKFVQKQPDKSAAFYKSHMASSTNGRNVEKTSPQKVATIAFTKTLVAGKTISKSIIQTPYNPDELIRGVTSLSDNNSDKRSVKKEPADKITDIKSTDPFGTLKESRSLDVEDADQRIIQDAGKQIVYAEVKEIHLSTSEINTSLILTSMNPLPEITVKPHRQRKAWEWGLSFQAGRSSVTNGKINSLFSSGGALNFSNSGNLFLANPNQSANRIYNEPYPANASAGFSAGAFMVRKLSRRFAVSLGMNYTLFSTSTTVGKRIGSLFLPQSGIVGAQQSLNQSFRLAGNGSYTNKYHYIELPVILQTNLTRNWKSPLHWDAGFSLSRLIASNALHFDRNKGIYYNNNQLLNKTQFNIITGLPVTLSAANKKFALQAGPQFQYGFSRVLTNSSSAATHFLFIGLKANLVLGEK